MKADDNIKKLINQSHILTAPDTDEKILAGALTDIKSRTKSSPHQPTIGRIIMKSRLIKLAAAAVIIIAILLSITLLDKSVPQAYAIDQTIQASKNMRFIYFEYYTPSHRKMKEVWLEYDDRGQIKNERINWNWGGGKEAVQIWKQGRTQNWTKHSKKLLLFEDKIFTNKIISFAQRYDPARAFENIQKMEKEGKVKIEIDEPSNKTCPIILTAIWEPNTFIYERYWPQTKEVFSIDQSTKLVKAIETYELEDGQYLDRGVWEYPDYNKAYDAKIFSLEDELPADVEIIDMMALDIGLEQGDMTNEQVAIKLAREFFKALIAKDYEAAIKLFYHESATEEADIRKVLENSHVLRIISIDETFPPPPRPTRGLLGVSCILEIEKDGKIEQWEPNDIFVGRVIGHPNRWIVNTFPGL